MSLPKATIRFDIDADLHQALKALAEVDDAPLASIVERVISDYVCRRVHEATVIASRISDAGISRSIADRVRK